MTWKFRSKVVRIEEKFQSFNWRKVGDETVCDKHSIGWFLLLEGSHEALFIGNTKPELTIGQTVEVTIRGIE